MEIKKKVLVFNPSRCIGCRLCEHYCSMIHFGASNPSKSRIRILRDHKSQIDIAIYCHQCTDPPCIEACEYEALSQDPETGAILVDDENCVGCRKCITECPYAVPTINPDTKKILICNLCEGEPKCVEICPENAIQYLEIDQGENIYKSNYIEKVMNKVIREEE